MKKPWLGPFVVALIGVAMLAGSTLDGAGAATPVLIKRGIIPGLAGDSAPGPLQPAPTSTPPPPGAPVLVVRIDVVANELAYSEGSAVVPVNIRALVEGPVPSGAGLSYLSGAIVEAHPGDLCSWTPQFTKTALDMTASLQTSLLPPKQEVTMGLDGPAWHFSVNCPGKELRVPAFGEESLQGWLGLIFGSGTPNGTTVEVQAYSGQPSCLHNRGVIRAGNTWGTVTITVDILTQPCNPPPP